MSVVTGAVVAVEVGGSPASAATAVQGRLLPAHRASDGTPVPPTGVHLSGNRVIAPFLRPGTNTYEVLQTSPNTAGGSGAADPWRPLGRTRLVTGDPRGVWVEGGVVQAVTADPNGLQANQVTTLDTQVRQWNLTGVGNALLHAGGHYLTYDTADVRSLRVLSVQGDPTVDASLASLRATVDGTSRIIGPDDDGVVTVTPMPGTPGTTVTRRTGITCTGQSASVVGRWALVSCASRPGVLVIVDLLGGTRPWTVPAAWTPTGAYQTGPVHYGPLAFGDGVLVSPRTTGTGDAAAQYLHVVDLSDPDHTERIVGPVCACDSSWSPVWDLDDDTSRRLVYLDPSKGVRVVDLDWVTVARSRGDRTGPVVTSLSAGPRITRTSIARLTWTLRSGTLVVDQQVRYRTAPSGRPFGAYVYPAQWHVLGGPLERPISDGQDVCFSVQATNLLGWRGSWSREQCVTSPWDDSTFTTKGGKRARAAGARNGSATTLPRAGTSLIKTGVSATQVSIVALAGPGKGAVDVRLGGVKLGRVSLASATSGWRTFTLPRGPYRSGTLVLTSVNAKPVTVDTVALLRT